MVVVWNTQNVSKDGEVTILAKAHTDVDISTMKVAFFDDTRYLTFSLFISVVAFFYLFLIQQIYLMPDTHIYCRIGCWWDIESKKGF